MLGQDKGPGRGEGQHEEGKHRLASHGRRADAALAVWLLCGGRKEGEWGGGVGPWGWLENVWL